MDPIYRVELKLNGSAPIVRLVQAESKAKASRHCLQVLQVRQATQADLMAAVTGELEVESAAL